LDGFIADADDSLDWIFRFAGPNPEVEATIPLIGSVLAGRRTYDVGRSLSDGGRGGGVYGGAFKGPIFVITHTPPADDFDTTFLMGDLRDVVRIALGAADGKDLLILGANLAQQCLDAGLIDEILIHVAPILLGGGVRLFARLGPSIELEPMSVSAAGAVANLRFSLNRRPVTE
jgi:dihydrofolate reductase